MTTLQQIELSCPVCGNRFRSQAVVSVGRVGGQRTDFRERAAGTQPLPYLVHMCGRCGYAGAQEDFADDAEVSQRTKECVWKELSPRLTGGQLPGSEKYEAAATIAEWQAAASKHVGDLLLRAAWCCEDEGDHEAERYFRRHAAWRYERALASFDEVEREDRPALTYLVGELWRRIGDRVAARAWFDRVPEEVVDPTGQWWVIEAARQQRDQPHEWFG